MSRRRIRAADFRPSRSAIRHQSERNQALSGHFTSYRNGARIVSRADYGRRARPAFAVIGPEYRGMMVFV